MYGMTLSAMVVTWGKEDPYSTHCNTCKPMNIVVHIHSR
jgi:hypothetical protein